MEFSLFRRPNPARSAFVFADSRSVSHQARCASSLDRTIRCRKRFALRRGFFPSSIDLDLFLHRAAMGLDRGHLLRVLFVTTEMDDFVRVGGLAAVSAALPRALRSHTDVRIMLPGYRDVIEQLTHIEIVGQCEALAEMPACALGRSSTRDGLPVYVLLCDELYDRLGNPYGDENGQDWADNDIRFGRLAAAAAELAAGTLDKNWAADLVHANDWQAALVPAYLAWRGIEVPSILTIHNLAYQGLFPRESLRRIGAPESSFHIDGVEFYDKLSFLKGGLIYASHLTTVSATYAREITTDEFGCGLEGLLRTRSNAAELTGILNGIDESWDPRSCAQLAQQFGAGDWVGKKANADYVRKQFGLAVSRGPMFGIVARLVHQKGIDLVLAAADEIVDAGGQIVVPGSGEPALEQALIDAHRRRPDAIGVVIGFNEAQARRIFAGSDFTLMPSRFEPCGLSQMYAQRFGSLPIGHQTGGLAETITDGETGFPFSKPPPESFLGGVRRAFSAFMAQDQLDTMRRSAMGRSFSWSIPAGSYNALYRKLASV